VNHLLGINTRGLTKIEVSPWPLYCNILQLATILQQTLSDLNRSHINDRWPCASSQKPSGRIIRYCSGPAWSLRMAREDVACQDRDNRWRM